MFFFFFFVVYYVFIFITFLFKIIISGFRWAEAADLANNRTLSLSLPRNHRRKEPLGQANTNPLSSPESQKY